MKKLLTISFIVFFLMECNQDIKPKLLGYLALEKANQPSVAPTNDTSGTFTITGTTPSSNSSVKNLSNLQIQFSNSIDSIIATTIAKYQITNATGGSLSITSIANLGNNTYQLNLSGLVGNGTISFQLNGFVDLQGNVLTSGAISLIADNTAPTIQILSPNTGSTIDPIPSIDITFSEPVLNATTTSNYVISGAGANTLTISSATSIGGNSYRIGLSGSPIVGEVVFTLNNITDIATNALSANTFNYTFRGYSIGGSITNLSNSITLRLNESETITLNNGTTTYTFLTTRIIKTSSYNIAISSNPNNLNCIIENGSGTVNTNVFNANLICFGNANGPLNSGTIYRTLTLPTSLTTIAGAPPPTASNGVLDGTGTAARFNSPTDITTDGTYLYVTDTGNNSIRRILISNYQVDTFIASGTLNAPTHITTDGRYLYVSDTGNNVVRRISIATQTVESIATIANPKGIAIRGDYLYVASLNDKIVYRILRTSPFSIDIYLSSVPGPNFRPNAMTVFNDSLYLVGGNFGQNFDHAVSQITTSRTGIAGLLGTSGFIDGVLLDSRFNTPTGITTDGTSLYVADLGNFVVRKVSIGSNQVTTILGSTQDYLDGSGASAKFHSPSGVTSDGANLYIVDKGNHSIRKLQ